MTLELLAWTPLVLIIGFMLSRMIRCRRNFAAEERRRYLASPAAGSMRLKVTATMDLPDGGIEYLKMDECIIWNGEHWERVPLDTPKKEGKP